ncbi:MAG: N-acetyl-gamma-glutamyl-phosphate reductase, partial [Hyphomicrobiaceae bacterium]|nr:N-acetyl-gamma-glutamyl-phosphate reductase [Hyphomicrobiaceae bacterium]
MTVNNINIAVIGASGYTGADLVRLALRHPHITIKALVAKTHAGKAMAQVFPHLGGQGLPDLVDSEAVDWSGLDAVFCGLPHGTAHSIIARLPERVKVIDMSADFRLRDTDTYKEWYGLTHSAPELLAQAVYGLSEHYREEIAKARLVACPGCYPTATLMALLPVIKAGAVSHEDLIIDAKSGVTGAGRALRQNTLFSEAGEGLAPYAIAGHRHAPEIEQELSLVAKGACADGVRVNFTPHLVPMSRGELITCHVRLEPGKSVDDVREALASAYENSPFVRLLEEGIVPATQHVRGSNQCHIGVFADRIPGRAIVIAVIDNLVKGAAGQAIQN